MEDKKNIFGRRSLALTVILLGWVLCGYLMLRYAQLRNNTGSMGDICRTLFASSCDEAMSSPVSWHLGYPLPGWGLTYFGLLGLLFSFNKPTIDRIIILITAFGVGASAILLSVIVQADLTCPLCLSIHFINFLTLVALFFTTRSTVSYREKKENSARGFSYLWVTVLLVAIISGGFSEVGILKTSIGKEAPINLIEIAKSFKNEKVYDFPKSESSPHLGLTVAPVQLMVFSSFQCPACKVFAPSLENIHKKYGNSVAITFKNYPLSSTCNPIMSIDMQPRSCDAAFAAIAAHRQNRFWDYHDQLFQSNLREDEKALTSIAKNIGLNMEKWELDRHSNKVKEQLSEDIKTANEIGIEGTPSVFINGRRVRNFSEHVLDFLIRGELNKMNNMASR